VCSSADVGWWCVLLRDAGQKTRHFAASARSWRAVRVVPRLPPAGLFGSATLGCRPFDCPFFPCPPLSLQDPIPRPRPFLYHNKWNSSPYCPSHDAGSSPGRAEDDEVRHQDVSTEISILCAAMLSPSLSLHDAGKP
jgi:hypothetical protein